MPLSGTPSGDTAPPSSPPRAGLLPLAAPRGGEAGAARQHDGQTVAIFSHGAAMRIVLGTLQGLSLLEIGDTPFGDNTSVARLEAEGDDIRVLYRDDNSHLVQAGLSTLAKQKWWRQKGVQEMGQLYAPLTEEELESFMDIYDFSPPIVISDSAEAGSGPAYGSDITTDSIK